MTESGGIITRVTRVSAIGKNEKYISVKSCLQTDQCLYYIIDTMNDHQYAGSNDFVNGPLDIKQFRNFQFKLDIPEPNITF